MSTASVLIVDDEGPLRSSVKRTLDLHGYETAAAASYQERLSERAFDVLLTDLRMKGPDGRCARSRWTAGHERGGFHQRDLETLGVPRLLRGMRPRTPMGREALGRWLCAASGE